MPELGYCKHEGCNQPLFDSCDVCSFAGCQHHVVIGNHNWITISGVECKNYKQ